MAKVFQMAFELAGKLDSSFRTSFQNANDTMSRTRREIRELRSMQKGVDSAFKAGTINQQSYTNAMAKTQAQTEKLISVQSRMTAVQNMKNEAKAGRDKYGSMTVGAVGAGAALFAPAIASSIQFESAMADVKKVVDFDTPEQFKEMSQDIVSLSQRIPLATEGLAAIVAAGGQSGIARGELLQFAESAAKMGVAFDITADEAGEMMAKWRTAFKMNQDQVIELADKINYLGNTTAASAPKISDVVRRIGPLGEIGGVASGEIAALGASMVGAGIESEVAATGIKNFILGMVAGEGATKSQAGAFSQLGLDATEMAKRMQTDAKGAIIEILSRIQSLDKYEQASVLKNLFGSESLSAIAPLLGNLDNLKDNFNKVADAAQYTGSMEAEFAARSATTANSLQLTKNSINSAGIALGTIFLPSIASASTSVSAIANSLATWAQQNPETATTVGAITAGTLALVASVGALGWTYNFLKGNIAGVIGDMSKLHHWLFITQSTTTGLTKAQAISAMVTKGVAIAQSVLNATMYGCPVVWIIGGIMGVIAAGYLLYKNWDTVTAFIGNAWTTATSAIASGWNSAVTWVSTGVNNIKTGITSGINSCVVFLTDLPQKAAYGAGYVIGVLSTLPSRSAVFFQGLYTSAVNWTQRTVNDVGIWFSQLPNRAVEAGTVLIMTTINWWQEVYTTSIGWTQATINDVGIWLMTLPDRSIEAGMALVASVDAWASGAYDAAVNWIMQIPNIVSNAISNAGQSIQGFWNNITASNIAASFNAGQESGASLPGHAEGGIFNKPHIAWFAEAGDAESAIPINNSSRSRNLLAKTNELMGNPLGVGGGSIYAPLNPTVIINGGDSNVEESVRNALEKIIDEWENRINSLQAQQRRVAL